MEKEKIFVTKALLPSYEAYCEMLRDIWDSHWLTNNGKYHKELTERLEEYLEVPYLTLLCNGHMSLELAIQALGLRGEVITTPFTFASTTHAIARSGLTPVFCDINYRDYTIDVTQIEKMITEKTTAILPVHVYGSVCDVEAIEEIAKKHGLKVLYDAAHAFGVSYKGKGVGMYGDASVFSFHATKVFNTIEGGAVVTKNKEMAEKLRYLRNFGIQSEEEIAYIGANAKMNEFQAAMGLCNLQQINSAIRARGQVIRHYRERLYGQKGIVLLQQQKEASSNYAYMPVLFTEEFGADRDEIYSRLKEEGIYSRKYFYPLLNTLECYKGVARSGETPVAEYVSRHILTLPVDPSLTEEQIDRICEQILKCRMEAK